MAQLKNLHLLADTAKPADMDKMEYAAVLHKRHSNITFKIIDVAKSKIIFQAVQGKNAGGNYFPQKRLIEIVHETFDRFFPGIKIHVHATAFKEPLANKVDAGWINKKMDAFGIKLKHISEETGIDYTQLSSLVTGDRPLSQPMKALFWFYFSFKEIVSK